MPGELPFLGRQSGALPDEPCCPVRSCLCRHCDRRHGAGDHPALRHKQLRAGRARPHAACRLAFRCRERKSGTRRPGERDSPGRPDARPSPPFRRPRIRRGNRCPDRPPLGRCPARRARAPQGAAHPGQLARFGHPGPGRGTGAGLRPGRDPDFAQPDADRGPCQRGLCRGHRDGRADHALWPAAGQPELAPLARAIDRLAHAEEQDRREIVDWLAAQVADEIPGRRAAQHHGPALDAAA